MATCIELNEAGRIPAPGDNLAIAARRLECGTRIRHEGEEFELRHTVLEGHRFAIRAIAKGQQLLSWGLPFGLATQDIAAGHYACNAQILAALKDRSLDFALPAHPNFDDHIEPYHLDENGFRSGVQVPPHTAARSFMGYRRGGTRGVGTRNFIVLLGTTSRTASYVRQLESRLKGLASAYPNIDGIVAAAHTEGGGTERPNNLELILRTLSGFVVNPNVGAVLAVDYGTEPVTNKMLREYLEENDYPLHEVPHCFLTLKGNFQANLDAGEAIARSWLDSTNRATRSQESAAHLRIGLQCGGSDAFSGISSNPLISCVAKEIIQYGGIANLAETDELIGAESYVLKNVCDLPTARRFLAMVERFKERAAWHGASAEGNPSGGNKLRGLYNIVLKSIGAANKLHPDVRLDHVIEYGERMLQPGFYFMDSPGNDLESVAGQVAAGANMIFFTTGNGSITNFPFVPTLKIMNTTRRFELLSREMDVNAGAYLDGKPMEELAREMFELVLQVASGVRSRGEQAGHAQVSIWRNWRQSGASPIEKLMNAPLPAGRSIPLQVNGSPPPMHFDAFVCRARATTDQLGLILPTSLCAGQIARISAGRLNHLGLGREQRISRFVCLVHTEGCGHNGGLTEEMYTRTMLGYLSHPLVRTALLLEHGCERMHNDYMKHQAQKYGVDLSRFGSASVQLDGGIEKVVNKIEDWFRNALSNEPAPVVAKAGLESLRLGLLVAGPYSRDVAASLAEVTQSVVGVGGTVVVPHNSSLLSPGPYLESTLGTQPLEPSLAYGQAAGSPGFHIMETPTDHWVETLTGLGATGVEIFLAHAGGQPLQGHPLVPLLQISAEPSVQQSYAEDIDLLLQGDPSSWAEKILQRIIELASRQYEPKALLQGNNDFQLTRGLFGVSL